MDYPRSPAGKMFGVFAKHYADRKGGLEALKTLQATGGPWEIMVRAACNNPDTLPIAAFSHFDGGIEGVPEVVNWRESYLEGKTLGRFLKDYRATYQLRDSAYRWATVAEALLFAAVTPRVPTVSFATCSHELLGWKGAPGKLVKAIHVVHAGEVTVHVSEMDYLTPDTRLLAMRVPR